MPNPANIHPRKARLRKLISKPAFELQGSVGRALREHWRKREERSWKPEQTALGFMTEMGFPVKWSKHFLSTVTYYEPWLKERYEHFRCHLSRTGRLWLLLQEMSRNDALNHLQIAREQRRKDSERRQAEHIAQYQRENFDIVDGDLLDVMRPVYPGKPDSYLLARMHEWTLNDRLMKHYAARRRIPK